ncbi:hypothetical protein [Bdellovibrio sp. HCB337]|uniref:hypothetical protein n=1 Tax=Bdellovibrio sp. HCB337 TaxID=3394358 RepID=UPI0039A6D86C
MKSLLVMTMSFMFASSAMAETIKCKSAGDWNNSSNYRAEFEIKLGKLNPLSGFPTLEYSAEVTGWQDGAPESFGFQNASATVTAQEVLVSAQFEDVDGYAASFDAAIDRKTMTGAFAALDNSEEGTGRDADAKGAGGIEIVCK